MTDVVNCMLFFLKKFKPIDRGQLNTICLRFDLTCGNYLSRVFRRVKLADPAPNYIISIGVVTRSPKSRASHQNYFTCLLELSNC